MLSILLVLLTVLFSTGGYNFQMANKTRTEIYIYLEYFLQFVVSIGFLFLYHNFLVYSQRSRFRAKPLSHFHINKKFFQQQIEQNLTSYPDTLT